MRRFHSGLLNYLKGVPRPPRSVIFLHNYYYNFHYLAQALRARGWDAVSVSVEDPGGANQFLYHGEDFNVFDSNPSVYRSNIDELRREILDRFEVVHFAGMGQMALHPEDFDQNEWRDAVPWDFLEFKRRGKKIAYSTSGCSDGVSQTSFYRWSGGACDSCKWQERPDVCSDRKNLAWGHKLAMICDLICSESLPSVDFMDHEKVFRGPMTLALDRDIWAPDLLIPEQHKLDREPGEVLVYHGFANARHRSDAERNLKGTPLIKAAIERLQGEGSKVRLIFAENVPNLDVRYMQAQADVVVDQLHLGLLSATARESLMLGKPVVSYFQPGELHGRDMLVNKMDMPLEVSSADGIYEVLSDLISRPQDWAKLGQAGREYMLRWHDAEKCAALYEFVWDQLHEGHSPASIQKSWNEDPGQVPR